MASGKTAIDLLSPTQDQQVASANPTFSWGDRGAGVYTIEVATDVNFQNLVLSKNVNGTQYTLANADLIGASALSTNSYHWRVKIANIATNLQSKPGTFFLVAIPAGSSGSAGVIYVNTASSSAVEVGSKEKPYKRIQAAIANADALRNYQFAVTMDIYVAQGSYTEEVVLSPGISVRGGYEATNWTRNISGNTTTINAPLTFAVRGSTSISTTYTNTTWLEGFTINGATRSTSFLYMAAVDLQNTSPTIAYNTIVGGSGTAGTTNLNVMAIDAGGTGTPLILGNTIVGTSACQAPCNYAHGINVSGPAIIVNNVISAGPRSAQVSRGITVGLTSTPTIFNNAITGSLVNNTLSLPLQIENTAHPNIKNNIIYTKNDAPTCVATADTARPTAFQNNNVFGCTNLYYDGATNITVANFASQAAQMDGSSGTLPSYGNVNVDDSGPLFVDYDGADNDATTWADNDLRIRATAACNVRGGGQNLSASLTQDKDQVTRTITAIGCTPTNTGATNWSIGAFERD